MAKEEQKQSTLGTPMPSNAAGPWMSPGVYILEELTARSLPVSRLQDELKCSSEIMLEYLDGKRSVLPIARNLARFFGTSVSLWKGLDKQWGKRSIKRAENGQPTRESE